MNNLKEVDEILKDHEKRIRVLESFGVSPTKKTNVGNKKEKTILKRPATKIQQDVDLDFDINPRAFFTQHAKELSSGKSKFALVVTYLTEGKMERTVQINDIKKLWNKNTQTLGDWNGAYPTRAQDKGLVDSPARSEYKLGKKWKAIFD